MFILGWTLLSAVLDLIWLIVNAGVCIFDYLELLGW